MVNSKTGSMREIFLLIRDKFGTFCDISNAFVLPFTRRRVNPK